MHHIYPQFCPLGQAQCKHKIFVFSSLIYFTYLGNFIFIALILTEILAQIVKLTHCLTLLTPGGHVEINLISTISVILFREASYQY